MARGWESKGVESQMQDAEERKRPRPRVSPEQSARLAEIEGLEMSRRRVERELAETGSPLRRSALEHALAHLDAELKKLRE
jgi:hypothetical protein